MAELKRLTQVNIERLPEALRRKAHDATQAGRYEASYILMAFAIALEEAFIYETIE